MSSFYRPSFSPPKPSLPVMVIRHWLSVIGLSVALVLLSLQPARAEAVLNVLQTLIEPAGTTVFPNDTVIYKVAISCNSSEDPQCLNISVSDVLDPNLEYVAATPPPGFTLNVTGNSYTVTGPSMESGSTLDLFITARVTLTATPNAAIPHTVNVSIANGIGNNPTTFPSNPINLTVGAPSPKWSVDKVRLKPAGIDPAVDKNVTYGLKICSDQMSGNVNLTSPVLEDVYPAGAIVVSTDGGVDNGTKITWTLSDIELSTLYPPGTAPKSKQCLTKKVVLRYPSPTFAPGSIVDNVMTLTSPDLPGPIGDTLEHTFIDPTPKVRITKDSASQQDRPNVKIAPGMVQTWKLGIDASAGNLDITNPVLTDTLPAYGVIESTLSITSGSWLSTTQAHVEISSDGSTWTELTGSPVDGDDNKGWFAPADFSATITHIRWRFFEEIGGTAVYSVSQDFVASGMIVKQQVSASATAGQTFENCGAATVGDPSSACKTITVENPHPELEPVKTVLNQPQPGGEVQIILSLGQGPNSTAPIINPSLTDIISSYLEFVSWDAVTMPPGANQPYLIKTPLPDGSTSLRFYWSSAAPVVGSVELSNTTPSTPNPYTIPLGATEDDPTGVNAVSVKITLKVREAMPKGEYPNELYTLADGSGHECEPDNGTVTESGFDLDGNGVIGDTLCKDTATISVQPAVIILSQKWIKGDFPEDPTKPNVDSATLLPPTGPPCPTRLDVGDGFTRVPCVAQTDRGDFFTYTLRLENAGNIPVKDYILYDVLPFVGDTGVSEILSTLSRKSVWRPVLTGPIVPSDTLPAGAVIEYSDSSNSCRPEVNAAAADGAWQIGCVNDWTTTPDVWGDVRSLRLKIPFAAPDFYRPGQKMYLNLFMRVPSGAPSRKIAWNALAQRATNADNNERLLAAEPPKVGIVISPQPPIFDLALQKRLADGQSYVIYPNKDVTFTVTITNQGEITASEVSLIDYFPATFILSPNETNWTGGAGSATRTLTGLTLAPEESVSVNIILRASDSQVGVYTNTAEISSAKSITGANLPDVDSMPDASNDESQDNENNADGTPSPDGTPDALKDDISDEDAGLIQGADEDDHDIATVQLVMVAIGNRVWFDTGAGTEMDNGKLDASEAMSGVQDVLLQLYRIGDTPGTSTPVSQTTTIAGGYYQFDKLEPGQYFVHIPITNFLASGALYRTVSSTGGGADETSDEQGDENGLNTLVAGGINSNIFDLQAFTEPLTEDYETQYTGVLTDANVNFTADFSFVPAVAIGNRIWKDTGDGADPATINNGKLDSGETGIDGITVELYDENNVLISTTTTSNGGYYYFDMLNPGQYYVKIPASEFAVGEPLEGFFNSTDAGTNETTDQLLDENGIDESTPAVNGVRTNLFELLPFSEQTGEVPTSYTGALLDESVNATADLGFWEPLRLGNRVWIDDGRGGTPNDALMNGAEPGVAGVVLELRDENNAPVNDLITGLPYTTTTDVNGYYTFTNLLSDTYRIFIPAANFGAGQPLQGYSSSTPDNDADNTTDTDDNGINNPAPASNGISSGNVVLAFGTEPTTDASEDGGFKNTNSNLTVDFGFVGYDRGDLPDSPYATLLANSGADHAITPDLYFGSIVDGEYNGQPNNNANGDDNTGAVDDEDGIVFMTPFMPGTTATISLTAHVTPGITAFYAAFIDFNGDGDFDDSGEKLTGSATDGVTALNVPVPAMVSDTIYSRFRIALDAADITNPTGMADSGEVEDYLLMSLGNQVWLDNGAGVKTDANDGELDAGEQGIPGVTVTLVLSGTNMPIATTTTDASGHYTFTGLLPGDYQVIIALENFQNGGRLYNHASTLTTETDPNSDADNNDNGIDNGNPAVNGITSNGVTLTPSSEPTTDGNGNQSNLTVDFGFVKYDLGDLPDVSAGTATGNYNTLLSDDGARHLIVDGLFLGASVDAELDGQPSNETNGDDTTGSPDDEDGVTFVSPIRPGEVATITVVASMAGYLNAWIDFNGDGMMDAGGKLFGDDKALSSETNTLTFTVPANLTDTLYSRFRFTSNTGEALDPTGISTNGEVEDYVTHLYSLGNRVWFDWDNDGQQEVGEEGISGVTVELYAADANGDPTGPVILTDVTDADGYYLFDALLVGDYVVVIPASDFSGAGKLVNFVSSTPDEANANSNGDSNDNGLGIDPDPTDGIHSSKITLGDTTEPSESDLGPDAHGSVRDVRSNLTVDFGFWQPLSLGNRVWFDLNNDGQIDASEVGVADVSVTLLDNNGNPALSTVTGQPLTTTTNTSGYYTFTDLISGTYQVRVDAVNFQSGGALADYVSSDPTDATPDNNEDNDDNGINPATSAAYPIGGIISGPITVSAGEEPTSESDPVGSTDNDNWTVDFGFYQLSLGDRVWHDLNNNGIQDGDEAGVPNVPVTVTNLATGQVFTTLTGNTGIYTVTGLSEGTYVVSITAPAGYVSSSPDGNDVNNNSNTDDNGMGGAGGVIGSQPITLTPGSEPTVDNPTGSTTNTTVDFGIWQPLSLGNRVWLDENSNDPNSPDKNDGVMDASEPGVAGVVVSLLDVGGNPVTSTVTGLPITTTTDVDGYYTFTNLISGTYIVRITLPAGYVSSDEPLSGADPNNTSDSDDNGVTEGVGYVQTAPIMLIAGTEPTDEADEETGAVDANSNLSVDFGIWRPLNLGNQVWYDTNNDGLLAGTELGVDDIVVELYRDSNGNGVFDAPDRFISTTTTADGGYYTFTKLLKTLTPTGAYLVVITNTNFAEGAVLDNYVSSDAAGYETPGVDPDNDQDGDDNGITNPALGVIASKPITLTDGSEPNRAELDGDSNWTVDFGVYQLSVGDLVWIDIDNDGEKDATEAPINGVTVTLLSDTGDVIAETVTDGSGLYTFTGLISGTYVVSITQPAGYASSTPTTNDDSGNGDDHGTPSAAWIVSQPFDLTPGSEVGTNETADNPTGSTVNQNLDFGLTPLYSLGNRVWFDTNNDGDIANSEVGVASVVVNLLDSDGDPMLDDGGNPITATTDSTGYYRFDNLLAGDYQVEVAGINFADGAVLEDYFGSTPTEDDPNDDSDSNDNGLSDIPNASAGVRSGIVTLGVDEQLEPTSESDLGTSGQGAVKDEYANMTVDFGFYTMTLGNQVWIDLDNNGTMDGNETGVAGVPVSITNLATGEVFTATTDSNGYYTVTGLISGTYVVSVTSPVGYVSSTPDAGDPDTDVDDSDDNGEGEMSGVISSQPITLLPGDNANGATVTNSNGSTLNPLVDFGLTPLYSLGNRVWFDTNNDGDIDNNEVGKAGVVVNLLDSNGDPMLDGNGNLITTTTDGMGYYRFDNLLAGDYQVEIAASNFANGGVLHGYFGSTPTESNPNDDGDSNDNGLTDVADAIEGVRSDIVTLAADASLEPTGEGDLSATGQGAVKDEYANMTVDFGFYTLSLGDQVWLDANNNGLLDLEEKPLAGVTVLLLDGGGNPVLDNNGQPLQTLTDENGNYRFTGLISGTYIVEIAPPVGYHSSTPDESNPNGNGDDNDNGANIQPNGTIRSNAVVLLPADNGLQNNNGISDTVGTTNDPTVDFGLWQPASLGNYVWLDEDADGQQDAGEPGIPNVMVNLSDEAGNVFTTTTDSLGGYLFSELPPGTYTVTIPASNFAPDKPLAGMEQTPLGGGDSDLGNKNQAGYPVTLESGEENLTADFGYNPNPAGEVNGGTGLAALGDRAWIDSDGDGAQDANEVSVSGVELTLYSDPGGNGVYNTVVATDTTDVNGNYLFTNLPAGAYVVKVTSDDNASHDILNPTNYTQTGDPDHFGTTGANNDDMSQPVVLAPGDLYLNMDFGYQPTPAAGLNSVGDTVWFDADADGNGPSQSAVDGVAPVTQGAGGTADATDYGIAGVTVALIADLDGDGMQDAGEPVLAADVTDAKGQYLFSDLPDGEYIVVVTDNDNVLAGLKTTYDKDDGIVSPDKMSAVDLDSAGTSVPSIDDRDQDFGYTPQAQQPSLGVIGDTVWFDTDNNGGDQSTQGSESGLEGVVMELLNADGNVIATTITDENGHYYFAGLPLSTTYQVQVADENFLPGAVLEGLNNTFDPNGGNDNLGAPITLTAANPVNLVQDFSYVGDPEGRIGNLVWLDPNANGLYEPALGETPMAGVTVDLYRDLNGNGKIDADEPRLATTVTTGAIDAGQFGSDGNYIFANLPAGDYVVDVTDVNGVLAGYWKSDGANDGQNNNSQDDAYAVRIGNSNPLENLTADFGYYIDPAAVGNYVWVDVNGNGVQDDGETGINGVAVTLVIAYPNGGVVTVTTVTADDAAGNPGWYDFGNLLLDEDYNGDGVGSEAVHTISVALNQPVLSGYSETVVDRGGDDKLDSDEHSGVLAQPMQGQTNTSALNPASNEATIAIYDFGYYVPASLGNYVWLDEDANGEQDAGEPGLPNIVVVTVNDKGETFTTMTDNQGSYLFDALPPGTYTVTIPAANFAPGQPLAGMEQTRLGGGDSDLGNKDDTGYVVTLTSGEENLTADFGYNPNPAGDVNDDTGVAALGDRIWIDSDGDGAQDANEVPVSSVEVTLYNDSNRDSVYDTAVATKTTDANGNYLFTDLPAGAYVVKVTSDDNASHDILNPTHYTQTGDPDHFGTTGSNNDGMSTPIVLSPGDLFLNVDFGYQPTPAAGLNSMGDTVWFDADADGNGPSQPAVDGGAPVTQGAGGAADAADYGIAGVTVALIDDVNGNSAWDAGEPVIATDVTDEKGQYLFSDLPDGKYLVWVNDTANVLDGLKTTYDKDDGIVSLDETSAVDLDSAGNSLTSIDDRDQDFGYTPQAQQPGLGAVGDTIWLNVDSDNLQDGNEPGIEGVIVTLTLPDGKVITTMTDENGHYYFAGLPLNEQYTVTVASENFLAGGVLAGLENTADKEGDTNNMTVSAVLTAGSPVDLTNDLGYTPPAGEAGRIGNLVWDDPNANGVYEPALGETPIAGVTVDLYRDLNGNGQVDADEPRLATTVTTDTLGAGANGADGNYIFEGLPTSAAGIEYLVLVSDRADVLTGYSKSEGDNDGTNNNSQPIPYAVELTTAAPENLTADFGYYLPEASLGNYVWFDQNHDGLQGAGEPALPGVVVTLTIVYPNGVTTTVTTQTDANGHYEFNNLLLDEEATMGSNNGGVDGNPVFTIAVLTPASYAPTWVDVSSNGADKQDSDNHSGTTAIPVVGQNDVAVQTPVTNEGTIAAYDFGFWQPLSLGNLLWIDSGADGGTVNDGIRNGGEPMVPQGVMVELLNITGTVLATTTTDVNGYYRFDNLLAGEYQVRIPASEFTAGGKLNSFVSSTGQDSNFVAGDNNKDHGDDTTADGVTSSVVTLTGANPTGEAENGATGAGANSPYGDVNDNLTVDFGFVPLLSLGNLVFEDRQNNGLYEPALGDTGVAGVHLNLYIDRDRSGDLTPADGATISDTVTDASGLYRFSNLLPGEYLVEIDHANFGSGAALETHVSSLASLLKLTDVVTDPDTNVNHDDNGVQIFGANRSIVSKAVTLAYNSEPTNDADTNSFSNLSVDFGLYDPGIGNQVWFDKDGDGKFESENGETGIANVTLALYEDSNNNGVWDVTDTKVKTTTTDIDGLYMFNFLPPRDYIVVVEQDNFAAGQPLAGLTNSPGETDTDDNTNNDDNGVPQAPWGNVWSLPLTLTEGGEPTSDGDQDEYTNLTIDFGFHTALSLGNLVWFDSNNNGVVDSGEAGIAGVTVNLYRDTNNDGQADGGIFASIQTNTTGNYLFTGLAAESYIVEVVTPAGYASSTGNGSEPAPDADSDVDDNDDNGTTSNSVVRTAVTLAVNGEPTAEPATPGITDVTADANSNITVDFGFWQSLSLGSKVWFDKDNDGLLDAGEPGIPNVNLQLFKKGDNPLTATPVATTTTDAQGNYLFTGLPEGEYFVYIPTPPALYSLSGVPTDTNDNGEDNDDNGSQTQSGQPISSPLVKLQAGTEPTNDGDGANSDLTLDFGLTKLASLGDLVWLDLDKDGVQDAIETGTPGTGDERGIAGVLVTLFKADGTKVAETRTGTDGRYLFDDLIPGDYYVQFAMPAGYILTGKDQGGNDAFDSDVDGATFRTPVTTLSAGEHDPTLDMGVTLPEGVKPATLGDRVWYDTDKDGVQDVGETGVPGVVVELHRADGTLVAATTTDATGNYQFNSLPPGDYYIQIVPTTGYQISPANQGGNDLNDSDVDAAGKSPVIILTSGKNDLTWDAGLFLPNPPASLGNLVWYDLDADGVQDGNETGVPGVTVNLYDATGKLLASVVTSSDGKYLFENLVPGQYIVEFNPPVEYVFTGQDQGNDNGLNSDVDPATGRTTIITLTSGQADMSWDVGLYILGEDGASASAPAGVGNRVWEDEDRDGIQDPNELPLTNVTVKLYNAAGELIAITKSDSNGNYIFPNVVPGQYFVEFVAPEGYSISPLSNNPTSDVDSNVSPDTGRTVVISLTVGQTDVTWDAGFFKTPTALDEGDEPTLTQKVYLPVIER